MPESECMNRLGIHQNAAKAQYTEYIAKYCIGHIIASQLLFSKFNWNSQFVFNHILLQISYYKRLTREHEIYHYLSFGCIIFFSVSYQLSDWLNYRKYFFNYRTCVIRIKTATFCILFIIVDSDSVVYDSFQGLYRLFWMIKRKDK